MSKSELILGPAGAGKTTQLLNIIEEALQDGVPPQRIGCFAFSTKAAGELVDRAIQRFPQYKKKDFIYFRTLHSLAFKERGLHKADVMGKDHLNDFGQVIGGYDFKFQYDENMERPPIGGGLGDKALAVYAISKGKRGALEDVWRAEEEIAISWADLEAFAGALDKFKAEHNLHLFCDFMDVVKREIDIDVLILDEAQDFTAQQWNYALRVGANAKRIYIAGDDDQAIFEWAGADLKTLLSLNTDKRRVLPISYRLTQSHWELACNIVARISNRYPKKWAPRQEPGLIDYIPSEDMVDLSEGSWLLLARHQWELDRLEKVALNQGVAYKRGHRSSVNKPEVRAVVSFERLRRGKTVSPVHAKLIGKFISNWNPPEFFSHQLVWEDMRFPFSKDQTWMDVMNLMGYEDKAYIRAMRSRGEQLGSVPRVNISTIHMAKGGEADNVLLLPEMSKKTMQHYLNRPDPELRVWYVAATRAKENLHIVSPRGRNHFDGLF